MYTYSILTCLAKFSNPVWTSTSVMLIGVPLMISNVLVSFQTFTDPVILTALTIASTSLGLLSLVVYVLRWLRYIAHLDIEEVSSTDTILCSTYVLFMCIFLIGNWAVSYIPCDTGDPWSYTGVSYLTYYSYLMAGCTVSMTAMASSCSKLDAVESKNILVIQQMFMRFFSHEIRTPLNSVYVGVTIMLNELKRPSQQPVGEGGEGGVGGALLLLEQGSDRASLLETALDTQLSCQSAMEVLNSMILYDRIINGLVSLEKRAFDPFKLVCDVVDPFKLQAAEASIDLQVVNRLSSVSLLQLNADPGKLSQAIRNLISNAMKFTNPMGSLHVTLSAEDEGRQYDLETGFFQSRRQLDCLSVLPSLLLHPMLKIRSPKTYSDSFLMPQWLVITVADSGIGISASKQVHIFDGLRGFKPGVLEQQGQGAGLGLFIAKQIVELHGGSLSVFSKGVEGEGSVFTVRLPGLVAVTTDNNDAESPTAQDRRNILTQPSLLELSLGSVTNDLEGNARAAADYRIETESTVLNVLVVDDSSMTRKMVCKLLQSTRRCNCDQAADGSIAVEMTRRSMLREPSAVDQDAMVQAGADSVLIKPLDIDLLWTIIDTRMGK
eukprot:gene27186-35915_t